MLAMINLPNLIPLSRIFIDRIANIAKEKYVIGFADAYGEQNWFPSSHHVALGSNYKARYNINENWLDEINKIHQTRTQFIRDAPHKLCAQSYWGLDESYSSKVISENKGFYLELKIHLLSSLPLGAAI